MAGGGEENMLTFRLCQRRFALKGFADASPDAAWGVAVISRTSAMHYKGTNKSLPEIARELKFDAVVEGTVQRSGDRVHVRAQLIHAPSDSHLWTAEYDRDLRDAFDLQSEVARAIAARCASRSRRPNNDYSFQRESLLVKLSTITCKVATS
jgi:hypothetical protein